jgi:hypothetical protein
VLGGKSIPEIGAGVQSMGANPAESGFGIGRERGILLLCVTFTVPENEGIHMSEGGGGVAGFLGFILIIGLINLCSWLFDWSFWIY